MEQMILFGSPPIWSPEMLNNVHWNK